MAKIEVKDSNGKVYSYYMENKLKRAIDKKILPAMHEKDEDYVIVLDGEERAGKSTMANQIASYIDPTIINDFSRVCFSPDEFRKAIINAKKKQAVIFDEAYRGLAAKGALTEVNRILVSLMMEMGQKNLFVIIVLPTFYLLEKYVALWRARGLFHVYRSRQGRKGYFIVFNNKKKNILFLQGKKDYSYRYVKSGFRGRFYGKYIGDEDKYRKKKEQSLMKGYKSTRQEKFMEQRNQLIYMLYKEMDLKLDEMVKFMKIYGIVLKKTQLSEIIKKIKKD